MHSLALVGHPAARVGRSLGRNHGSGLPEFRLFKKQTPSRLLSLWLGATERRLSRPHSLLRSLNHSAFAAEGSYHKRPPEAVTARPSDL